MSDVSNVTFYKWHCSHFVLVQKVYKTNSSSSCTHIVLREEMNCNRLSFFFVLIIFHEVLSKRNNDKNSSLSFIEKKNLPDCYSSKDIGSSCKGKGKENPEFRWYWDTDKYQCLSFKYSGCKGNGNNYKSAAECYDQCLPGMYCTCGEIRINTHHLSNWVYIYE